MFWTLLAGAVKLFLASAVILYAGLILVTLRTKGTHYHVGFNWRDPVRSSGRLLVWAGAKVVGGVGYCLKAALETLEETSADVGEWLLHHRGT